MCKSLFSLELINFLEMSRVQIVIVKAGVIKISLHEFILAFS